MVSELCNAEPLKISIDNCEMEQVHFLFTEPQSTLHNNMDFKLIYFSLITYLRIQKKTLTYLKVFSAPQPSAFSLG